MANKVSFIIQLQDKFSRAAKSVNKQIKNIGKSSIKTSKIIKNKLGESFKKLKVVALGAMAAIGITTVVAFKKMISVGSDFQDSIADLSSITGTTGLALSKLTDETFRLAKASAISQSEVAGAFTQIASAKSELLKDPKGLSVVTEQVLLLANAAGISVPDAVRASVGALNQFNRGSEDAARFVNVIAAGAKVGSSLVGETAEALKNAGAVASQFNVSFEETNALIQVLAKNELKGAEAGTALKTVFIQLEGLMGGALAPSKIGIIQSLELVKELGLSNTEITKEFGREALTSILILRKNIPLIKQWTGELTGTNVAQEQANVRLATFNARVRILGIAIEEKMIKVFLKLEPILSKQVNSLRRWFDGIKTENIDALVTSLKVLLKILSLIGKAISASLKTFDFLAGGVGAIIAGAVLSTDPKSITKQVKNVRGFKQSKTISQTEVLERLNRAPQPEITSRFGRLNRAPQTEVLDRFGGLNTAQQPDNKTVTTSLNAAQQPDNKSTIAGEIVVRATQGTTVESTKLKTDSKDLNMGINMIAQGV